MRIVIGQPVVEWVAKHITEHSDFGVAVGMGVESEGRLIGGVVFNEWNGVNVNMHTACEAKSRWLTRSALWYFFDYPFNQLKAKRITALVGEGNVKSQKLIEGVGFRYEAELVGAHPTGNLLIYVMRKQDCRWIGKTPLLQTKRVDHEQMAA